MEQNKGAIFVHAWTLSRWIHKKLVVVAISGEGNWDIKEAEGGQFLLYVPFWTIDEFSIKKKKSHQSDWSSLKSLQIINAREDAERTEPSYAVGGNVN